ncbi:MAG: hypothetical protein AAGH41_11660 [Pseudomonadota bacterium]
MKIAIASVLALSSAALASSEAGWQRLETLSNPAIQYIAPDGGPGTLLTCANGNYGLMITLDGMDATEALLDSSRRRRSLNGELFVDGEATYKGGFRYKLATKAAEAYERKPAAQIFNAVVRGQKVEFKLSGKSIKDLELPGVNEAFREFAKECKAQASG